MGPAAEQTFQTVRMTDRFAVAEGTVAFCFEKPPGFTFTPGQFVEMSLVNPSETDEEGDTRAFTIASTPAETSLMVATRIRDSAFKRVLRTMPLGTAVRIEGPFGKLTLHEDAARPAIFLAGGIGITPFRSMIGHATTARLPHRLVLFYSNRRPEDAAFLDELQAWQQENPNYTFVGTMTQMEKSSRPWTGATGYLTPELLARYAKEFHSPLYYVVGPPGMVAGIKDLLKQAGVAPLDIRTETFAGY